MRPSIASMNDPSIAKIAEVVQTNCHIADAEHAGNFTMCTYLLKMREYYRWEKALPFQSSLPNGLVGDWLVEREAMWEQLQGQPFRPVVIDGQSYDPFHSAAINEALLPRGLVYSGGLGTSCRPHFFLARLARRESHQEYEILVAADEFARDLSAPPAMSHDRIIYIRRESLRRMLWEKVEEWNWRKQEGAMERAVRYYGFDRNLDSALEAMTDNETESVILHEIGEIKAGGLLGEDWHHLLAELPNSAAELMVRAVRDHLADCVSTLPALIESPTPACLHFYFGNLRAMRKQIFPELSRAYQRWIEQDDLGALQDVTERGERHWRDVALQMLDVYQRHGPECQSHIERIAQEGRL